MTQQNTSLNPVDDYQYCDRCRSIQWHTYHKNDIDGEWFTCDNCQYKDENPELFDAPPPGFYGW